MNKLGGNCNRREDGFPEMIPKSIQKAAGRKAITEKVILFRKLIFGVVGEKEKNYYSAKKDIGNTDKSGQDRQTSQDGS